MNIHARLPVGWDMHPVCHIYSILCLLRLQLEDPSAFTQAAPERRAGDDVACEVLELRPHIYLRWQHSLPKKSTNSMFQLQQSKTSDLKLMFCLGLGNFR